MTASSTDIAFVGIGNMGAPMVRCLAKAGFSITIYDVADASLAPFRNSAPAIRVAGSLAETAAAAPIVITMLPDSAIVRRAVLGEAGGDALAAGLRKGQLVIDMSSSFPLDTRRLGADLAARGVGLVDAPVSGGVGKAVSGTLAILAGGDEAAIERARAALEAMGRILKCGPLGAGHAMKALNNYVSAAGLVATAEALVVAEQFGLDPKTLVGVLNASTGRNNTTENKAERYMLSGSFNSGFAMALMNKDVGMARRLAEEMGLDMAELGFVSRHLESVLAVLGQSADHTAVYDFARNHRARKA
ncbi:MAG: NAD(P)-dependent oxidoreductase [Hyphomicrobiaceae bacterium]